MNRLATPRSTLLLSRARPASAPLPPRVCLSLRSWSSGPAVGAGAHGRSGQGRIQRGARRGVAGGPQGAALAGPQRAAVLTAAAPRGLDQAHHLALRLVNLLQSTQAEEALR